MRPRAGPLVIHLPRELDHHNCRNLKYETDLLMAENYISRILFDFNRDGVHGQLRYRHPAEPVQGDEGQRREDLSLRSRPAQVLRVLKIAGIPALMEMYDSEEAAFGGQGVGEAMKKREVVTIKMDSVSENEEFARVAVAVFLSRMNPTLEEIEDVKTAVSEAVTNAVIHGYQGGEGTITLEVSVEEDVLTVLAQDEGVGIRDVAKAMEPMYTTAPDGERSGMGFSFMEAFMDQVEVVSAPGSGTTVTMRKKIGR